MAYLHRKRALVSQPIAGGALLPCVVVLCYCELQGQGCVAMSSPPTTLQECSIALCAHLQSRSLCPFLTEGFWEPLRK